MSQFMFLFRGAKEMSSYSPEEMESHMGKWKAWMGGLAEQGKLVDGLPLDKSGKLVSGTAKVVTDGPYAEGKEVVGGYLIVKADDLDSATEISKGCPIFENDGSVLEVREIMSMG